MNSAPEKPACPLLYDGSFDGFLSVIFQVYQTKPEPLRITREGEAQPELFTPATRVNTNCSHAARVLSGLERKLSAEALHNLFQVFLSEEPNVEMLLFRYIKLVLGSHQNMEQNYAEPCVLQALQLGKRVRNEKHRMEAFVRFRKMADGSFLAVIAPEHNVLPLISAHFEDRYADQKWVIYDRKRRYGLHYDLEKVEEIRLETAHADTSTPALNLDMQDQAETDFQELWKCYFTSVNIPERKNPKLQLRHLPKRYWRYLPEKQPYTRGTAQRRLQ